MSKLIKLSKEQITIASTVLKDAFKKDPVWDYVFKDDKDKDRSLTAFFIMPLLFAHRYGHVYATSNDLEGIIAYVDGKKSHMSMLRLIMCGAIKYGPHFDKSSLNRLADMSNMIEPKKKVYMKNKNYIHLTIIGVKESSQNKGYGKKLLNHIVNVCDMENQFIYLETETQQNVDFYQQFGFEVLEKVFLKDTTIPLWLMQRKPNSHEKTN